MKKFLVVFNKKSGRKKASSNISLIYKKLKRANLNFKFVTLSVLPFVKNIEQYDTIVAVGGDGTINKILPYLVNTDKKLGIIPLGTANLLAANLNLPENLTKAIDVILNSRTIKIDCAKVNNRYFILRIGFGYDAEILSSTKQEVKNILGYLAYFFKGIVKIFSLKNQGYKIKLDNEIFFTTASTVIIANSGNMFKNIFTVTPEGTLNDGKLDVFIRKTRNLPEFIEIFLRIIFKCHKTDSKTIYAKASKIRIKPRSKFFHIDGEINTTKDEISIEVVPKSINVLVP